MSTLSGELSRPLRLSSCWGTTPLGRILIRFHESIAEPNRAFILSGLYFEHQRYFPSSIDALAVPIPDSLSAGAKSWIFGLQTQIDEYFANRREVFNVQMELGGTPFQRRVWERLTSIPFGTTISYGEIAMELGNPRGSRAVGAAVGKNPISLIIPCHRVIGGKGSLTGYAGGIDKKRWLLDYEFKSKVTIHEMCDAASA